MTGDMARPEPAGGAYFACPVGGRFERGGNQMTLTSAVCLLPLLATLAGAGAFAPRAAVPPPAPASGTALDARETIARMVEEERGAIAEFFGDDFPRPFATEVLPDRAAFTALLAARWGVEQTECWMVAVGVADLLAVLSPDRWSRESCEHDPADTGHLRRIIAHELVHVYHGQQNPTRDFEGMDDIGWFPEGLAVYASRQLANEHAASARAAIAEGQAPAQLEAAWSGPHRYGVSGSLVAYLDERWGRAMTRRLLSVTTEEGILSLLGVSEDRLLRDWREWATRDDDGGRAIRMGR